MRLAGGMALLMVATGSTAQEVPPGQVARSSVGEVGQRQAAVGVEPLGRLDSRIANRVQSRIRNRIDRSYDPRANAISPFKVAGEQAQVAGRSTRR